MFPHGDWTTVTTFIFRSPMGKMEKNETSGHYAGWVIIIGATNSSGLQLFRVSLRQWYLRRERGGQVAGGVQLRTAEPAPGSCVNSSIWIGEQR
jgi:hypothetical protein